jgi:sulfite reductase alpha subunit-like flavoprotein
MNGHVQKRSALILYGTETGNAQDLAEELGRVTERLRYSAHVAELDSAPITLLSLHTITIVVISTTGQGEFPSNARAFWNSLLKKKLPPTLLQHVRFCLVGLGDTSYPKFNWAARKLGKRMKQLGALEVVQSCEADEQGEESTDGAFLAWLPQFKASLLEAFPLPNGLQPIPDDQPLPSKWLLQPIAVTSDGNMHNSADIANGETDHGEKGRRNGAQLSVGLADYDLRPIPDSFQVVLEENKRVTPASHWQDVRLLTMTTGENIDYRPGDALSILPKNFPEDVQTLIQLMGWTAIADNTITIAPAIKPTNLNNYPPCLIPSLSPPSFTSCSFQPSQITLRHLLTSYLDITSIPRRTLFTTLSRYTSNPTHRDRLLEFTLPQYLDEYYDYATRPRRSILEILQEFDSVKIPWVEAANVFPAMRGRHFSVASGGALKRRSSGEAATEGTKFELLVAIVKYKTVIKKTRQGVCTRYLAALAPGSTLNVVHRTDGRFYNKKGKGKDSGREEMERPKLLIGAGTGIAPLRALVTEEEDRVQNGKQVLTALVFGSRNQDTDFFFADEWAAKATTNSSGGGSHESKSARPDFKLITAFSRDQAQKIYIQDRLREHADVVFDLLVNKNATVVVCGSSGAMPKAVRQAIVDALVRARNVESGEGSRGGEAEGEREGGEEEEEWTLEKAEQYLDGMEKTRRYLQETW